MLHQKNPSCTNIANMPPPKGKKNTTYTRGAESTMRVVEVKAFL
jgi:hypothetical protein